MDKNTRLRIQDIIIYLDRKIHDGYKYNIKIQGYRTDSNNITRNKDTGWLKIPYIDKKQGYRTAGRIKRISILSQPGNGTSGGISLDNAS